MQIFPESIRSLWEEWELRVLVLLSLLWQAILIILGKRRKYSRSAFTSFTVWIVYLSADWLATVSLGNLANNQGGDADKSKSKIESKDQLLQALWAPFLLLHLGGPDTITAYALEDNNLWLRHLLGLLVEVSVAFYVFLLSWGNNALTFIAIPVFVSGIIKYSERTWALRAASPQQFQDSLLSSALILQAPNLEHIRGYGADLECVHKGYFLFPLLKRLYAGLSLRTREGRTSYSLLAKEGGTQLGTDAFKVVEVQLGFLFDVLYTKATIIYRPQGLVLRLISVLSMVSALVAFTIVIDGNSYSWVDVVITYVLFVGAVSLEIYAFASLILSDWTMHWLTKGMSRSAHFVYSSISRCRPILCHEERWSGYMGQHNLVDFCLKKTKFVGTNPFDTICFEFSLLRKMGGIKADDELKLLILTEWKKKIENLQQGSSSSYSIVKDFLSLRGYNLVKELGGLIPWSCEVEFGHSIFIWHVATDICYYSNLGYEKIANHDKAKKKCEASKKISDYLLYILLMRPSMLPTWIDRIKHVRGTFNHAISLFHQRNTAVENSADACRMLGEGSLSTDQVVNNDSLLFDGHNIASQLLQKIHEKDELWEVICGVWMEMMTNAASHCEWGSHVQQLRNGGEFLTHVCLLMAELWFK